MYWIFHGPESELTMKSKLINSSLKITDEIYLDMFHTDPNLKMKYLDIFNKQLHKLGIYRDIINLISNDKDYLYNYYNDWKYAKRMAEDRITKSFKQLYNEVSEWTRNRIMEKIREKMKFSDFFEEDEKHLKCQIYESFKVNELLKKNQNTQETTEILEQAYKSQKGNQLLVITFYALKKLEEKGFIEELEKSYGIYMGVDDFVKQLKQKLNEINSYKKLHEWVGVELENEKTELIIVVEAYERAKRKIYIRDPNENNRMSTYNNVNVRRGHNTGGRGKRRRYRGYHNGYGYNQYW
jgi:hypothetical protein